MISPKDVGEVMQNQMETINDAIGGLLVILEPFRWGEDHIPASLTMQEGLPSSCQNHDNICHQAV